MYISVYIPGLGIRLVKFDGTAIIGSYLQSRQIVVFEDINVANITPVQTHDYCVCCTEKLYIQGKEPKRYSKITFGWGLGTIH